MSRNNIVAWFKTCYNITINVDQTDRWEDVDIPNDILTLLLLKYKGNYHDAN